MFLIGEFMFLSYYTFCLSQGDADMFYNTFNGQRYNTIEPDICRLVYVARVETTKESEDGGLPIPGKSDFGSPTVFFLFQKTEVIV